MQKSSFVTGLLNSDEKTIAEYLATWDDLNVFFKTLDTSWDFVSQLWKSDREIKRDNKIANSLVLDCVNFWNLLKHYVKRIIGSY